MGARKGDARRLRKAQLEEGEDLLEGRGCLQLYPSALKAMELSPLT